MLKNYCNKYFFMPIPRDSESSHNKSCRLLCTLKKVANSHTKKNIIYCYNSRNPITNYRTIYIDTVSKRVFSTYYTHPNYRHSTPFKTYEDKGRYNFQFFSFVLLNVYFVHKFSNNFILNMLYYLAYNEIALVAKLSANYSQCC